MTVETTTPPTAQPYVIPSRPTLMQICSAAELDEPAMKLAETNPEPRAFIDQLVADEQFPDAVKFLAHSLPRREAVWWAWVVARKFAGPTPKPPIKASIDATERWIVQPTDENRRAAMAAAQTAEFGTPAGCAGLAAFLSSGSMVPANLPEVPPGEYMTAKAVTGGVCIAAVAKEPEKAPDHFKEYITLGLEVAERTKLWT
jgi:hypothetical protein